MSPHHHDRHRLKPLAQTLHLRRQVTPIQGIQPQAFPGMLAPGQRAPEPVPRPTTVESGTWSPHSGGTEGALTQLRVGSWDHTGPTCGRCSLRQNTGAIFPGDRREEGRGPWALSQLSLTQCTVSKAPQGQRTASSRVGSLKPTPELPDSPAARPPGPPPAGAHIPR